MKLRFKKTGKWQRARISGQSLVPVYRTVSHTESLQDTQAKLQIKKRAIEALVKAVEIPANQIKFSVRDIFYCSDIHTYGDARIRDGFGYNVPPLKWSLNSEKNPLSLLTPLQTSISPISSNLPFEIYSLLSARGCIWSGRAFCLEYNNLFLYFTTGEMLIEPFYEVRPELYEELKKEIDPDQLYYVANHTKCERQGSIGELATMLQHPHTRLVSLNGWLFSAWGVECLTKLGFRSRIQKVDSKPLSEKQAAILAATHDS